MLDNIYLYSSIIKRKNIRIFLNIKRNHHYLMKIIHCILNHIVSLVKFLSVVGYMIVLFVNH